MGGGGTDSLAVADNTSSGGGGGGGHTSSTTSGGAPIIEDAAELQFGSEFDGCHILCNSQVAVILSVSASSAVHRDEELNEVYRRTQKYVNRFNSMSNAEKSNQELVNELDNLAEVLTTFRKETTEDSGGGEELELHPFEVSALMNLVATDTLVEEALALIPSLVRFPEAAIDEILDLIRSTMIRIVS